MESCFQLLRKKLKSWKKLQKYEKYVLITISLVWLKHSFFTFSLLYSSWLKKVEKLKSLCAFSRWFWASLLTRSPSHQSPILFVQWICVSSVTTHVCSLFGVSSWPSVGLQAYSNSATTHVAFVSTSKPRVSDATEAHFQVLPCPPPVVSQCQFSVLAFSCLVWYRLPASRLSHLRLTPLIVFLVIMRALHNCLPCTVHRANRCAQRRRQSVPRRTTVTSLSPTATRDWCATYMTNDLPSWHRYCRFITVPVASEGQWRSSEYSGPGSIYTW